MTHTTTRLRTFVPLGFILMTIGFAIPGVSSQAFSQSAHPETRIHVTLIDFNIHPAHSTAKTGWVAFHAVNAGTTMHELVILRTDIQPDNLPRIAKTDKTGAITGYIVNEEAAAVKAIDEIEEFPAGTRKDKNVFLDPGRYVLFCNIPEHYDKGMYASLLVEE